MPKQQLVNFLLVEDDDDHSDLVMRALKRARILNHMERVRDGVEAIMYLNKEGEFSDKVRPDIVLLDLKLPKKDGFEVLKEIRESESLRTMPVVILSTSSAETDRAKAYTYHANSYLNKPVDFDQFQKMVEDLCLYWGVWNEGPPHQ